MKRLGLREIARQAGVSIYTVSLALRDSPKIAPATADPIRALARRLGYVPHAALAEVMGQVRQARQPTYQSTIGYLDATPAALRDYYTFKGYRDGTIRRANELGYKVDLFEIDDLISPPVGLDRILRARGICSLIMMWPRVDGMPKTWRRLWRDRVCIFLATRPPYPTLSLSMCDHFRVGVLACQKAMAAGHRRIGVVLDPFLHQITGGRFLGGIYSELQFNGAKTSLDLLIQASEQAAPLLAWYRQHRPDCIITMRGDTRRLLAGDGVRVPDEVSLIFWDTSPQNNHFYAGPEQDPVLTAESAIDFLVGQVRHHRPDRKFPQQCVLVEPQWRDGPSLQKCRRAEGG